VRFVAARDAKGELLGENLPGLKVAFSAQPDSALAGHGSLQRWFSYVALLLVLSVTIFGAYLLWRDLQREVRLAEVRAQFVSSVSHELKTPLTAIRMFAETLQMGRSQDPETQAEYLDTMVNECERLTRLVDDVLLFSKIEQGKKAFQFKPASLAQVVAGAARAFQYPLAQQGFELQVSVEDELPPVPVDRDALQQAILNLLTNAMKYSGDARTIELALARRDQEAVIRVTDHGVGIAPEEHARIFEKYYRAPTRENQLIPGTGLGLTLVAQIVKAHGGRVEVRSAPGQGSTFLICLPIERES
jgi:signal transduction histidine kinase